MSWTARSPTRYLSLRTGLTLSIRVRDVSGRPIPSATGTLGLMLDNKGWNLSRTPARADEQGRIEMTALPHGWNYTATVTSRGFSAIRASVPIQATLTNYLECPPPCSVSPTRSADISHFRVSEVLIDNRRLTSSRPQSRLQVGAPDCRHFVD